MIFIMHLKQRHVANADREDCAKERVSKRMGVVFKRHFNAKLGVHLFIDQKLREKQNIPHTEDRQQEQGPGGEQNEYCPVTQLQEPDA